MIINLRKISFEKFNFWTNPVKGPVEAAGVASSFSLVTSRVLVHRIIFLILVLVAQLIFAWNRNGKLSHANLTPTLAGLDIADAGGWSLWTPFGFK